MKVISKNFKTATVGTLFGGSLLFTAGLGIAGAEPVPAPAPPDGLVNVAVGNTTILDSVPLDVAGNASAAICGSVAADVHALAQQVDTQGVNQTVCPGLPGGDLILTQNVIAETPSPVFPETESDSAGEGTPEGPAEGSAGSAEGGAAETPTGSAESAQGDTTGAGAAEPPAAEDAG